MKKFLKALIGIMLIPVCYGFSVEFFKVLSSIHQNPGNAWTLFAGGAALYLLIHILLPQPVLVHVYGHELTHAVFARLFGWKLKSLKATANGGEVRLTGSNFIVTLAPYFFPLYSFLLIIIYIFAIILGYDGLIRPYFLFLIGFTITLHILMTIESLRIEQPDIKEGGVLFSIPLIYLGNMITITLLLRLTAFRGINYGDYVKAGLIRGWETWKTLIAAFPS